ncbi:hypothetical protein Bca52824_073780 [Brassica carinata]|uniref:F-box domain-containing protein n=1 Tax=Brassica carinata TaxID=52824 RepID=A0A8X7U729_BRACI|nr:hypothetical protein Bca52824_073780 [Brassica carinata]
MSDLPTDIYFFLLSRVPAMSLKRLRSTCKRWNALFKDSRFTDKHFLKAGKQSLVLTLKVSGVMLASFSLNVDDLSIEIKVQLSLKDSHSGSVCLLDIFHCNGLLLCTTTRNNRIVVCNPWLGETRWIQIKPDYVGRSTFALGHDNNNCCDSY